MKRSMKILLGAGVLAASGGVAAVATGSDRGDGPEVPTVVVRKGTVVAKALAVGTIEPDVEVGVKSKVSGVVRRRFAEVGDMVEAGAPLLEIRPDPTPLELVDARRQVELREIEVEELAARLDRQEKLAGQGLVSEQELESARRTYREAALQVQAARERLALLEDGRVSSGGREVESVVRSPIRGSILEKMVEIGDPVVPLSTYQEGTVLLRMADMDRLVFRGTVDEIDVGRLAEGMPALLKVGALPGAPIQGVLSRISLKAQLKENARVFPVEIALTETAGALLRAGFSANAEIIIAERPEVLTIPERVVHFESDSAWVEVHVGPEQVERRIVRTGLSDAITVEVLAGLAEGETVREKEVKKIQ